MLQTVPQCTETAGAGHQCSLEMTSPDKCSSDSSPTLWLQLRPMTHASPRRHSYRKGGLDRTRAGPVAAGVKFSHAAILMPRPSKKRGEVRGQRQVMQSYSSSHVDRCDALLQCINSPLISPRRMPHSMYHILQQLEKK